MWGNQADDSYEPTWKTYAYHSRAEVVSLNAARRKLEKKGTLL
jgi:hypothetical protein